MREGLTNAQNVRDQPKSLKAIAIQTWYELAPIGVIRLPYSAIHDNDPRRMDSTNNSMGLQLAYESGASEQQTAVKTVENRKADSPDVDTSLSNDGDNSLGADTVDYGDDTNGTGNSNDDGEFGLDSGSNHSQRSQLAGRSRAKTGRPHPNGRSVGRQLVMWHRPRMMEKLMLHVQYECQRAGIQIPWDKAVQRLIPGSSGTAAIQYLNRLRDIMIGEGHMVPPVLGKLGTAQDPSIRGYVRDMDAESPTTTRIVGWDETIEDRKENLVVPGVIRGSGNYRRKMQRQAEMKTELTSDEPSNFEKIIIKSVGSECLSQPSKNPQEEYSTKNAQKGNLPSSKAKCTTKVKANAITHNVQDIGTSELDSDNEYNPKVTQKPKTTRQRSARTMIKREPPSDSENDQLGRDDESGNGSKSVSTNKGGNGSGNPVTPVKPCHSNDGFITPPETSASILKLSLDPSKLSSFPVGVSGRTRVMSINIPPQQGGSRKRSFSDASEDEISDVSPCVSRRNKIAKLRHDSIGQYGRERSEASPFSTIATLVEDGQLFATEFDASNIVDKDLKDSPPNMGPLLKYNEQAEYQDVLAFMSDRHDYTSGSNSGTDLYNLDGMNYQIEQDPLKSLNMAAQGTIMSGGSGRPRLPHSKSALTNLLRGGTTSVTSTVPQWKDVRSGNGALPSNGFYNPSPTMPLYSNSALADIPIPKSDDDFWVTSDSYPPALFNNACKGAGGSFYEDHSHNSRTSHHTGKKVAGGMMEEDMDAYLDDILSGTSANFNVGPAPCITSGNISFADRDDLIMEMPTARRFNPKITPTTRRHKGHKGTKRSKSTFPCSVLR